MLIPVVKSLRDSQINTICVFSMTEPTLSQTTSPACDQPNVCNRSYHLYSRTCTEKCVGGPAWYTYHYPILTSILPSVAEIQPSCKPSHRVFSRADWEQFHDLCLENITEDILGEVGPLHSFVKHITKAGNDSIPRATTIPRKSNPWFDEECREALKARRALDKKARRSREIRGETQPSDGHRHRLGDFSIWRNASHGQTISQSCQLIRLLNMYGIEWGKYRAKTSALPSNILIGRMELPSPTPKILQMSMRQHSWTIPQPPTAVLHPRP